MLPLTYPSSGMILSKLGESGFALPVIDLCKGIIRTGQISGTIISSTEFFNGFSWTIGSNLNISRGEGFSTGSQFAMIYGNGLDGGGNFVDTTSLFNGNTWATSGTLDSAAKGRISSGSNHAAFIAGGLNSGGTISSRSYFFNGTTYVIVSADFTYSAAYAAATGSFNNSILCVGAVYPVLLKVFIIGN